MDELKPKTSEDEVKAQQEAMRELYDYVRGLVQAHEHPQDSRQKEWSKKEWSKEDFAAHCKKMAKFLEFPGVDEQLLAVNRGLFLILVTALWKIDKIPNSLMPLMNALMGACQWGFINGYMIRRATSKVGAGSGKEGGTHVATIKRRLICCHLRERPGKGFAAYWQALCEPADYIRSFLDSCELRHGGEEDGIVTLIHRDGRETEIKKKAHARLFRMEKRKNDRSNFRFKVTSADTATH